MIRYLQFVRLGEFVHFLAAGWIVSDSLHGTHHGEWSIIMEWAGDGEP